MCIRDRLSSIDTDAKVAKQLGIRLVLEDPHITLREENIRLNEDLISECDVVIVARVDFGEENYCNLESVKKALELNKCVYFIDGKNFFQRDFTNGRATAFFKKLLAMGARDAGSEEELAILLNK